MADHEPLSPGVKVFMTKEEALWVEWERGVESHQGSSSKGTFLAIIPKTQVLLSVEAGPSGRDLKLENVDFE